MFWEPDDECFHGSGKASGEAPVGVNQERRVERRWPRAFDRVELTYLREMQSHTAAIADLSESGIGLVCVRPLPAGAAVRIDTADGYLSGVVCNCSQTGTVWRVGVRLRPSNPFEPAHLLSDAPSLG